MTTAEKVQALQDMIKDAETGLAKLIEMEAVETNPHVKEASDILYKAFHFIIFQANSYIADLLATGEFPRQNADGNL